MSRKIILETKCNWKNKQFSPQLSALSILYFRRNDRFCHSPNTGVGAKMTFCDQQVEIKSDSRQNYSEFRSKQRILGKKCHFSASPKISSCPPKNVIISKMSTWNRPQISGFFCRSSKPNKKPVLNLFFVRPENRFWNLF